MSVTDIHQTVYPPVQRNTPEGAPTQDLRKPTLLANIMQYIQIPKEQNRSIADD